MRRAFRPALWVQIFCFVVSSLAHAHHDTIPDPPPPSTANKLSAISNVDRTGVTVSGLSSGGFFAHQFHLAFSTLVNGAGIIAGGPFGCVESIPNPYFPFMYVPLDRVSAATVACTHYYGSRFYGVPTAPPEASASIDFIGNAHAEASIDDPANVSNHRVWLFHGRDDRIVPRATAQALRAALRKFGVTSPAASGGVERKRAYREPRHAGRAVHRREQVSKKGMRSA